MRPGIGCFCLGTAAWDDVRTWKVSAQGYGHRPIREETALTRRSSGVGDKALPAEEALDARRSAAFALCRALRALYSAFCVASPYLAALVAERGLSSEQIGVVFALATLMRLAAAPLAGGIADRFAALRLVLGGCLLAAAGAALLYVSAGASIALVVAVLLHAMALAPAAPISDALALTAAKRRPRGTSAPKHDRGRRAPRARVAAASMHEPVEKSMMQRILGGSKVNWPWLARAGAKEKVLNAMSLKQMHCPSGEAKEPPFEALCP